MQLLEFKTKITDGQLVIPSEIQTQIAGFEDKNVNIVMIISDPQEKDDVNFKNSSENQVFSTKLGSTSVNITIDKI